MKKALLFFVAASLAVFGTSCSNDDSSGSEQSKLVLTSNTLDVMVGESVSFNVTTNGKTESGAELYIDSKKITNPHVFETEGEFKVVAKKNGFTESNPLIIKVFSNNSEAKQLSLSASKTTITIGESVSFNITVDGTTESGAELFVGSDKITNPHVFETEGTYDVIAKKQGFGNSNNVKITVVASNSDNGVVGKWIPKNISVSAMGSEVLNENYPHKATCDEDYFEFKNDSKVEVGMHDDDCVVTTSGADWSIQGNILKFNAMDYDITATVVSNTATKLVITANGKQFEPLVPILMPDADPSLLALLPLANITITLEK